MTDMLYRQKRWNVQKLLHRVEREWSCVGYGSSFTSLVHEPDNQTMMGITAIDALDDRYEIDAHL